MAGPKLLKLAKADSYLKAAKTSASGKPRNLVEMNDILAALADILEQRKTVDSADSYVAGLHAKGLNKILEKVGEEATEAILAAKDCHRDNNDKTRHDLVSETADLWFHSLVMLSHLDLGPQQVLEELQKRFNISGLAEKASRQLE